MPRGWAGCRRLGMGDPSVGSAPGGCRGWACWGLVNLWWYLMTKGREGMEMNVCGEWFSWGRDEHCCSQQGLLPALGPPSKPSPSPGRGWHRAVAPRDGKGMGMAPGHPSATRSTSCPLSPPR